MQRGRMDEISSADLTTIEKQLGRTPRDVHAISYRCPCGKPAVVSTLPRLADGTPFPTFYYATCPKLTAALSRLESDGLMEMMNQELAQDDELALRYKRAHEAYLADRESVGKVSEIEEISAGGMPDRVKCLHALAAHSLSVGPGVNPVGDQALVEIGTWWSSCE